MVICMVLYGSVWFFMVLYDIFSCLLVLYHTTKCLFLISTKYSYSSVDIKGINLKSQPTNGPLRNVVTSFILVAKYLLQCPNCSILVHPSPPSVISGVNCIILFIWSLDLVINHYFEIFIRKWGVAYYVIILAVG